jgi:hypothetical protein
MQSGTILISQIQLREQDRIPRANKWINNGLDLALRTLSELMKAGSAPIQLPGFIGATRVAFAAPRGE